MFGSKSVFAVEQKDGKLAPPYEEINVTFKFVGGFTIAVLNAAPIYDKHLGL